ncbi:MAG: hypothetical protein ABSE55_01430 [Terracidiphilus sp.]|jgi:uncharacterized protein YdeI (BOF family)
MRKFLVVFAAAALISVSALAQTAGQNKKDTANWTGFYAGTVMYIGIANQYDPDAPMTHTATLTSNIARLAVNYRF